MSKTKKVVIYIFSLCLSAAVLAVVVFIGRLNRTKAVEWQAVACLFYIATSLVVLLSAGIGNFVARRFIDMKKSSMLAYIAKASKKAQNNTEKLRKSATRAVVFLYAFFFFLIVLFIFTTFALAITSDVIYDMYLCFAVIVGFLMSVIIASLITPPIDKIPWFKPELKPNEFPLIYSMARSAANAVGYNGGVRIFLSENTPIVYEHKNRAVIFVSYRYIALFTQNELYSLFVYELGKSVSKKARQTSSFSRALQRFDICNGGVSALVSRIFRLPVYIMERKVVAYRTFANIGIASGADETIKQLGLAQSYVNSIAKANMISKYIEMPVPEIEYYFYESEVAHGGNARLDIDAYKKYLDRYGKLWKYELDHELPSRFDKTTATTIMRIREFGMSYYDEQGIELDAMYVVEQQRAVERTDEFIMSMMRDDYEERRKRAYLDRNAAINALQEGEEKGEKLDRGTIEMALWALHGLDDERAIEYADKALSDDPSIFGAHLVKAQIYSRRHDDRCVECFKLAAKDSRMTSDAYGMLCEYARLTGNGALYDECSAAMPELMKNAENKVSKMIFKSNTITQPCDLSDEEVRELFNKTFDAARGELNAVYVTKYVDDEGNVRYPVAFALSAKASRRLNRDIRIYFALSGVLQSYNHAPEFVMVNPNRRLMKKVVKAVGVKYYEKNQ